MAPPRLVLAGVVMASSLLGADCSSSSPESGAGVVPTVTQQLPDDTPGGPADVAALDLGGDVDRIVAMIPPPESTTLPDSSVYGGGTVLAAHHVLRAPTGDGGVIDLWIMRLRNSEFAPGVQTCRVLDGDDIESVGCSPFAEDWSTKGQLPFERGWVVDFWSTVYELSGPVDMTHFIMTAGEERIAVVTIEGEALFRVGGACLAGAMLAAWRGDELIREERSICAPPPDPGAGG